jgi:hypothetical protein
MKKSPEKDMKMALEKNNIPQTLRKIKKIFLFHNTPFQSLKRCYLENILRAVWEFEGK